MCIDSKKLVIFDWDGTLFDTRPICRRAAILTIEKLFGNINFSQDFLKSIETDPIRSVFNVLKISDQKVQKIFIYEYFNLYRKIEIDYPLIDDVYNFIIYLSSQDYQLAIATGRSKERLLPLLEAKGILSFFNSIRCIEDGPKKPDPYILLSILDQLKILVKDSIFIGDSLSDYHASINANMDFIYAKYAVNKDIVIPNFVSNINELYEIL